MRPGRTGQATLGILAILFICLLSGCGGTKHAATPAPSSQAATTTAQTTTASQPPNALQGEAASAATGDIPDNQVYVVYANAAAGYSMKYPEGWAQSGSGKKVVFRDKNNIVRVVIVRAGPITAAQARADLSRLRSSLPTLKFQAPVALRISGAPAIKVVYTTESAPNPVTNKRVTLTVDRYYLAHAGKRAIVDLGTPVGVDNVDAYRLMIQSFRWR